MRTRHRVFVILLALLGVGTAIAAWPGRNADAPASGAPVKLAEGPALEQALAAVADGDHSAPRDRWDPAYVAWVLGSDPLLHLAWVRERSVWVPYHGALRGPTGVLMDRQGNSLDRALLLAATLRNAGHEVRLAHARMDAGTAASLLPHLVARRRAATRPDSANARDWQGDVEQIASRYGLDEGAIARTVEAQLDTVMRMYALLDERTADQTAQLTTILAGGFAKPEPDLVQRAVAALRDHWWVQWRAPDGWSDLDLLGDAGGRSRAAAELTVAPEDLEESVYHRVAIRLVAERAAHGHLVETRGLEYAVRTADQSGPIVLQVLPEKWQPSLIANSRDASAAFRALALEQQEWSAVLTVGSTIAGETRLTAAGAAHAPAGGAFGGLGAAIGGAVGAAPTGELTAAWLEYEISRPGDSASVVRRQLFDLVGPARRASGEPVQVELDEAGRLTRALALFRSTEILLLASAVAPEYLTHLAAQSAIANREFLRSGAAKADSTADPMERFGRLAKAVPTPLHDLAVVRFPVSPASDVFLDRPNVLTRHQFLASEPAGVARVDAIDIVANDVGVALDAPRPAEARLRQGVRDTNAESLLRRTGDDRNSVAMAYAGSGEWVAITSPEHRLLPKLAPDIRQRILDDLRDGYAVVAPADASRLSGAGAGGWWRIDLATGSALGVSEIGWGSDLIKYFVIIGGAVASMWTFEYLLCTGALGSFVPGSVPVSAGWLVGTLHAESAEAACIWQAWAAGISAGLFQSVSVAWPFVVARLRFLEFFDRPLWATGGAGAGGPDDPLPIFGEGPPAPPPPERCPPGAVGSAEPAPAPEPVEGPPPPRSGTGSGQPGEEVAPAPRPEEAPGTAPTRPLHPDEAAGDMPPFDEDVLAERVDYWNQRADAARPQLEQAKAKYEEAYKTTEAAQAEFDEAAAAVRQLKEGEDATAAVLQKAAAESRLKQALQALEIAKKPYADRLHAIEMAEYWGRLQPLNRALVQARGQMREATQQFARAVQEGRADFEGSQYRDWQAAFNRYQQSLRDFASVVTGRNIPNPVPGNTQALPYSSTVAAEAPPAVPGPVAPSGPGGTVPLPGAASGGRGGTVPLPGAPAAGQPGGRGGTVPLPGNPAAGQPAGGRGGTMPLGNTSGSRACPGPASSGEGGTPPGTGPFQGDPANRQWLRENWHPDPAEAHPVARALGDPAIYDNADAVAAAKYNAARTQGMDDQAARQASFEEWNTSVQAQRRAQGIVREGQIGEFVNPPVPTPPSGSQVLVGTGGIVSGGGKP